MHRKTALGLILVMAAALLAVASPPARAATNLTYSITVSDSYEIGLGWDQIGLDSNKPYSPYLEGPNEYAKGVRVCNPNPQPVTNVTVTWVWEQTPIPSPYIYLQPGSANPLTWSSLAAGACVDAYFNIEVDRETIISGKPAAWETFSRYRIDATAYYPFESVQLGTTTTQNCYDIVPGSGTTTCGTGPYDGFRQIFVEKIQSQSRNHVHWIRYMNVTAAGSNPPSYACTNGSLGPATVYVGYTYYFCLESDTATNGYQTLTTYVNLKNTIFQTVAVAAVYSAPPTKGPVTRSATWGDGYAEGDQIFEDACQLTPNPYDVDYRTNGTCQKADKVGGTVEMVFTVKILAITVAPDRPVTASALIYDNSGASWHYNADFGTCDTPGVLCDTIDITEVGFERANATRTPDGDLLEWQTGYETDNLGFNVYREAGGERVKLNNELIAGSALSTAGAEPTAGRRYHWLVPPAEAPPGSRYWIEAVDLDGTSQWYGPVAVTGENSATQARSNSATLASLADLPGRSGAPPRTAPAPDLASAMVATSATLAGGPAAKIGVNHEGWYRVPLADIAAAGVDVSSPNRLRLYAEGVEQPILIRDGAVEFYGLGLDTLQTDARVYWLVRSEPGGKRVPTSSASGGAAPSASFPATVEGHDRGVYFVSLLNGATDNFFGAPVRATPVDQTMTIRHLAGGSAGSLRVTLRGVTAGNHLVSVSLNGLPVGQVSFKDKEQGVLSVPVGNLVEGDNIVTLASSGTTDISLVDTIRVTYQRAYAADGDALRFTVPGGTSVGVGGFSDPGVRVVDVTNAGAPVELAATVTPDGSGGYAAAVTPLGSGTRTLFAFVPPEAPAWVTMNVPSSLRSASGGADMVIVTTDALASSMKPLTRLHSREGLSTKLVDVEDLYDEFGYGEESAGALKAFLAYARAKWSPAPRFVLLGGDGSLDPRGYLGSEGAAAGVIPVQLVDTETIETASDSWFADTDNDFRPDFALGRFPVQTRDEARALVAKTVAYASAKRSRSLVIAADQPDASDFDFPRAATRLAALAPKGAQVTRIDRANPGSKAALLAAINEGPSVLNYIGHGSVDLWRGGLLTSADALGLSNANHPVFFIPMTCLNGYFQDPKLDSISEAMLKARGGAVAAWASSGETYPDTQAEMNRHLYRALFSSGVPGRIGTATVSAMAPILDKDVLRTWTLLGDPAAVLR